ncbi:hypothetical protein ACFP65_01325 [Marinilactibacillus sp. GCM10026970]|uniref:hypothetical protein n=1 Tax=Marinilactibacillus sp. GCM10026970 TaxID=3252642 RepID=UPI0036137576
MRRDEVGRKKLFLVVVMIGNLYVAYLSYEQYKLRLQFFSNWPWQSVFLFGIHLIWFIFNLYHFMKKE